MTTTATTTVIAELARRVGVPVSSRMPSTPKPQAFIIVSRIGGGMEDWAIRSPRFLVECYAHTELDAEALAETAYEAWARMRSAKIQSTTIDTLTRYDDPDPKLYRFQFTGGVRLLAH